MKIWRALVYFILAYVIQTALNGTLTLIYASVNHTDAADAAASSMVTAPSFTHTVPFHLVISLVVYVLSAWLYFRRPATPAGQSRTPETLRVAVLWTVAAIVVDFVGFVVIQNPWSLTPHEFYVDYQPWITLIYVVIFASPFAWLLLSRSRRTQPTTVA